MAARNTHIAINPDNWTEITDSDVTSITVQNLHDFQFVWLAATNGVAAPALAGAVKLPAEQMFVNENIADLWPGASGAVRVFALAQSLEDKVFVSHA